eukprot:5946120-Prymnesium_polylepis.2
MKRCGPLSVPRFCADTRPARQGTATGAGAYARCVIESSPSEPQNPSVHPRTTVGSTSASSSCSPAPDAPLDRRSKKSAPALSPPAREP